VTFQRKAAGWLDPIRRRPDEPAGLARPGILPGGAFYHASKYAVEGLSDALRMEVAQFGIDVVLIEPGLSRLP
jgi:NAD(P)-dependent dehydrogenase (short-subunit alcohol dehydrogenase family)